MINIKKQVFFLFYFLFALNIKSMENTVLNLNAKAILKDIVESEDIENSKLKIEQIETLDQNSQKDLLNILKSKFRYTFAKHGLTLEFPEIIRSIALSKNNKFAAVCFSDIVRILNIEDLKNITHVDLNHRFKSEFKDFLTAVEFSNDGKLLVTGSYHGVISIWSLENLELIKEINVDKEICSIVFNHDDIKILISCHYGNAVLYLFDISDRTNIKFNLIDGENSNHCNFVVCAAFLPNGNALTFDRSLTNVLWQIKPNLDYTNEEIYNAHQYFDENPELYLKYKAAFNRYSADLKYTIFRNMPEVKFKVDNIAFNNNYAIIMFGYQKKIEMLKFERNLNLKQLLVIAKLEHALDLRKPIVQSIQKDEYTKDIILTFGKDIQDIIAFNYAWESKLAYEEFLIYLAKERSKILFDAVKSNDIAQLKKLIKLAYELNIQDHNGDTLLHYAVRQNSKDIILALLTACPRLITLKNNNGLTAIDLAVADKHELLELFIRIASI